MNLFISTKCTIFVRLGQVRSIRKLFYLYGSHWISRTKHPRIDERAFMPNPPLGVTSNRQFSVILLKEYCNTLKFGLYNRRRLLWQLRLTWNGDIVHDLRSSPVCLYFLLSTKLFSFIFCRLVILGMLYPEECCKTFAFASLNFCHTISQAGFETLENWV